MWEVAGHRYVRCIECDAARLDPLPAQDEASARFDETYFVGGAHGGYLDYDRDATLHRRNARARLARVAPFVEASTPRLVDVGCASGYVLDEAAARGWHAVGVDASPWARDRGAQRGHDVHESLDAVLGAGAAIDVVTVFQVAEHVVDPFEMLRSIHAALRPGGVVAVETWDRTARVARMFGPRWQQANPPSVVHLFTLASVQRMLERAGFDVVLAKATPKLVSVGLVVGVAEHRWPRVGPAARRVATAARLDRVALPYPLADLVTVVGRRR